MFGMLKIFLGSLSSMVFFQINLKNRYDVRGRSEYINVGVAMMSVAKVITTTSTVSCSTLTATRMRDDVAEAATMMMTVASIVCGSSGENSSLGDNSCSDRNNNGNNDYKIWQ